MKALRGIGIMMVFIVAATLFAYIAFVHPIGTQFVRGKVTAVVAEAQKIVKEQVRPAQMKPDKAPKDTQPPLTPVVVKKQAAPKTAASEHASLRKYGTEPSPPASPRKATPVAQTKPRPSAIENPFKLERSKFSRTDIDAIIEQRRRIKDKLGEL
jgi:hypothetical protein